MSHIRRQQQNVSACRLSSSTCLFTENPLSTVACPCDKSKTILTTTTTDYSHHCQLTDHDIVDQPCDCYQETETYSEELPPPAISCNVQVNYNQVVVKCQILQESFLQNFNMQKFQNMEHANSRTFQGLSRAWNFFSKIQGLLKDPMNPDSIKAKLF